MNPKALKSVQILSKSGIVLFLISSAAIAVHFLVMFFDFYFINKPLLLDLEKDFIGSAFALPMVPFIGAYLLFCVLAYYFWIKMKKALVEAQEKELQAAKDKTTIEATQRLVGIIAQHVTIQNADILKWIGSRRSNNKNVPEQVEQASRNISAALEVLTEVVFVAPYSEKFTKNNITLDDIDNQLRERLALLSHQEREAS